MVAVAAHRRRVLVVDDSGAVRIRVAGILRQAGFDVAEATDGIAAAQAVFSEAFDAVVTDQTMPAMSGLQLCRLLHADHATEMVPVVLLTATSGREVGFWAGRCGAAGFVAKNALGELLPTLERVLSRPRLRPPSRPSSTHLATRPALTREAVHARVADLLDRELGDAILAGEVRRVGQRLTDGGAIGDLPTLSSALGELVSQIMAARWFWLSTSEATYVFCAEGEEGAAHAHVQECLADAAPSKLSVTLDSRFVSGMRREQEHQPVVFANKTIGTIGVGAERVGGVSRLPLIARELAGPLQVCLLLLRATRQAVTDGLTGLGNRRAAMDCLEREISFSRRHTMALGVVLVDLDHFKQVNDRFGHGAGDRALVAAGCAISKAARTSDFVARWGGEEFLIVVRGPDARGTRTVAERIRAAIAAAKVDDDDGNAIPISASCGVATLEANDTVSELVARADRALYAAKANGRNRVEEA